MISSNPEEIDIEKPFLTHIAELRYRLISSIIAVFFAFIIGFSFYNHIIDFLICPFGEDLYITQIEHGFSTKIRLSAYIGLILSLPVHIYNIIMFILPAMTPNERRILLFFLLGSLVLVIAGSYMAYVQILPLSIEFLKSSSFVPANVKTWLDFRESMYFVFQLVLAFSVLFQLPLVLLSLMIMNVISRAALLKSSRYFIILIFIISAIITPPDIVSQIGLSLPLILLFYLTVFIAKLCKFGDEID